jgi:hypothetical protein
MPGQLHSPPVFSRRKRGRYAPDKAPVELQRRTDSRCVYLLLQEKHLGATVLILMEIPLAASEVEYEDRRTDIGPSLFHYLIKFAWKPYQRYIIICTTIFWNGRIFPSTLVRYCSSVLMCIFIFGFGSEPRIDRSVTYRAKIVGFMNCTTYLQWAGLFSRYSDWLRAWRSGDRICMGARFFAHVQTGPGAHPASCTMGTVCFTGVKRPGSGADQPPHPSAKVVNE